MLNNSPMLFSFLLFVTFIINLAFGVTVMYLNPKGKLNRQFFWISIALCFWSFGFSMANSAPTMEIAFFWRRVAAIGWSTIYAMMLHMILILTQKNERLNPKQYFLLYSPALVILYVFGISKSISVGQYNLFRGEHGWFNVTVNNGWDWFFYVYYLGYILVGMGLLLHWRKVSDNNQRKQANILLVAIISIAILGTLSDMVLNSVLEGSVPNLAPLFNLTPILNVLYSIKHNTYMKESVNGRDDLILTSQSRFKLYFVLSILFLTGGVITSLTYFFPEQMGNTDGVKATIYASCVLYLIGIAIMLFQMVERHGLRDFLVLGAMLLSIPIMSLIFIEYSASTVWVFPLILIIVSLVFSSRAVLLSITVIAVLTQVTVFISEPVNLVYVDKFDYLLRIFILLLASGIGVVINKIYISRLKENIHQANSQKLLSKVSHKFIRIDKLNMNDIIGNMLGLIGEFFDMDRAYIFTINHKAQTMTYAYEWCASDVGEEEGSIADVPLSVFPWWMKKLNEEGLVYVEDVSKMPDEEAESEKAQLTQQGVKSLLVVPIQTSAEMIGFVGLDAVKDFAKWSEEDIALLNILANILSDGLTKIKSENEIEYMAYYDHLTGLANRTLFTDRLNQAIGAASRTEKFVAVIFMDLDGFKVVNDTIGHSGGDQVLQIVAHNLTQILRKTDTVARFGGDEFLILVNNIEEREEITNVADKVMEIFKKPFAVEGHEFFLTGSAGISVYPVDGEDAEVLIKNADIAMYKAKASGKNQYIMCTKHMKEDVKKKMILSNHLFRAIDNQELIVYYQPQISFKTGKIIGIEALLRWQHPEHGMVPPDTFIPLAEKNGAINRIGEWVLRTACQQNKLWQEKGLLHTSIAVNLSVVQLNDPFISEKIEQVLVDTGLDPKYLDLEITESVAIKENNHIVEILTSFKDLGVTISIDDFGTEYSSLSRLRTLPIDKLKIDMQFIQGIEGSAKDQAITKIIISLAKSLNFESIAEGVETQNQFDFLNQKMCDIGQGYYYHKPMPAEEMEKILMQNMHK